MSRLLAYFRREACGDSRDRTVFGHLELVENKLPVQMISKDILK